MQTKTAALLLLATAVGGRVLLHWHGTTPDAPGAVAFHVGDRTDLAAQRSAAMARTAEVAEGETIDVDRAGAGELARLPGVGPALARRIVAERERGGAFGGGACLDARVAGVGAGFLRRVGPHMTFSGPACTPSTLSAPSALSASSASSSSATPACPDQVSLNTATAAELECLPGIGGARAESILALRERRGGFQSVEELRAVHGLSERVLQGLKGRVRITSMP